MTISEPRFYTDEEVALILREAGEAAHTADSPGGIRSSSSGLSLEQLKSAAAEAGLDPSLVERAALRITTRDPVSLLERAAGGPRRHRETIRLTTSMSEKTSARLLSAIRAAAEVPGEGRADASGFFWHGWYRGTRLSVTAHEDSEGTRVQILAERGAPMFQTLFWSQFAIVMAFWMLAPEVNSVPDLVVLAAIPTGVLAAARALWKSSSRKVRERIAALLDAVRKSAASGGEGDRMG